MVRNFRIRAGTRSLTFSNNAYLKLNTEGIMLHGELAIGSVSWQAILRS